MLPRASATPGMDPRELSNTPLATERSALCAGHEQTRLRQTRERAFNERVCGHVCRGQPRRRRQRSRRLLFWLASAAVAAAERLARSILSRCAWDVPRRFASAISDEPPTDLLKHYYSMIANWLKRRA